MWASLSGSRHLNLHFPHEQLLLQVHWHEDSQKSLTETQRRGEKKEVLKIEDGSLCSHLYPVPDTSLFISPMSSSYRSFIGMRTLRKVEQKHSFFLNFKKKRFGKIILVFSDCVPLTSQTASPSSVNQKQSEIMIEFNQSMFLEIQNSNVKAL